MGHCHHFHEGIFAFPRQRCCALAVCARASWTVVDRSKTLIAWHFGVLTPGALRHLLAGAPERRHCVRSKIRHRRTRVPDIQGLRCRGGVCCGRGTAPLLLSPYPTGPVSCSLCFVVW